MLSCSRTFHDTIKEIDPHKNLSRVMKTLKNYEILRMELCGPTESLVNYMCRSGLVLSEMQSGAVVGV